MSKKLSIASAVMTVVAAAMSLLLLSITPALAHHSDGHQTGSDQGAENTKGNDRKSGYENNSKTPQEPNHGKGSDRDGDADSNPATSDEDGHTSTNDQPNAHPSGKDKDGEAGGSGNQGKAESNPDDSKGPMRYEGVQGDDKPGGPGGTDLHDQDGNNGCGNDDDFNDDNNGWCGKPVKETETAVVQPLPVEKPSEAVAVLPELDENPVLPDEVLGDLIERDENPARPEGPAVLGIRLSPALAQPVAVAGAVLPFTGGEALTFLIAAFALILGGAAVLMFRRSEA